MLTSIIDELRSEVEHGCCRAVKDTYVPIFNNLLPAHFMQGALVYEPLLSWTLKTELRNTKKKEK